MPTKYTKNHIIEITVECLKCGVTSSLTGKDFLLRSAPPHKVELEYFCPECKEKLTFEFDSMGNAFI
jgi:hypothetical protein